MANHKRRRPKHRRAGCPLCKRHKLAANKNAGRAAVRCRKEGAGELRPVSGYDGLCGRPSLSPSAGPLATDVGTGPTGRAP